MIAGLLLRLPPLTRAQWQLVTALIFALTLALSSMLLKPAIAELVELRQRRAQSEQAMQAAQVLRQQRLALEAELGSHPAPEGVGGIGRDQMQVRLIGQINAVAARHDTRVEKLAPGPLRRIAMLDELPVEVELTGTYPRIAGVLLEVAQGASGPTVSAFHVERTGTGSEVRMRARLSVYLEQEEAR